jgi:lantibiotic biosynthesis protein
VTQQIEPAFLKQAELIGEKICRRAIWLGEECYWEDNFIELEESKEMVVRRPTSLDIYFGASGIALFLAKLHSVAPNELYRTTAESSAHLTLDLLENLDPRFPIGFYIGHAGIAYMLIELGEVFSNEQFVMSGRQVIRQISHRDIAAQELDIFSGLAGSIPVLLKVYRKYSDDFVLNLAVEYGDHLIGSAIRSDKGVRWFGVDDVASLTESQIGFAHGDAGIAWALLELSAVTGEKRFLTAAEETFRFQQTQVDLLRQRLEGSETLSAGDLRYALSWCNGAVGVCLSRLRAYELTQKRIYKDQSGALSTTIKAVDISNQNYLVCHGATGTSDLFIYASQILGDVRYKIAANQIGLRGIEQIEQKGLPWPCHSRPLGETLNLMTGLAGIGYFYLRLYDPEKTSPLTIILPPKEV